MFRQQFDLEALSRISVDLDQPSHVELPEIDLEIVRQMGMDDKNFNEKISKLCQRWMSESTLDSEASRLIAPTLKNRLHDPLIIALIADDLTSFQHHLVTRSESRRKLLALACLCGAQTVGNDLLNKHPEYKHIEFLLPYTVASSNVSWAKELAAMQSKILKRFPLSVYFYSHDPWLTNELEALFFSPDEIITQQTMRPSV